MSDEAITSVKFMWRNGRFYDESLCSPRVGIESVFIVVGYGWTCEKFTR